MKKKAGKNEMVIYQAKNGFNYPEIPDNRSFPLGMCLSAI